MTNNTYAAPTANLENFDDGTVIPTRTFSAQGRLSVLSHLGQLMVLFLVSMATLAVLGFIAFSVAGLSFENLAAFESVDFSNPILIVLAVIAAVLYIVFFVLTIIMAIKRLHDRNHSGWWALPLFIALMIPIVNFVAFLAYLYVLLFPGQKTANRFGAPRPTKGWEKVLGILYLVFIIGSIVAAFAMGGAAFMSGAGAY